MEEKKYLFRREDTGELVEVEWGVMMRQQDGYITLPDGVTARRCVRLEQCRDSRPRPMATSGPGVTTMTSDALGFPVQGLEQFERDRVEHGFTDVEFVPDPSSPWYYQVKCASRAARDRYAKHRGMHDQSDRCGGAILSQEDLDRATEMVSRCRDA